MTDTILRKTIYLKATPKQVWAYLTEPEKLAKWFHKPAAPLVDGEYEIYGADSGQKMMWGTVLLAEPYKRLEYTFVIPPMGDKTSTVKWALDEVAGGTRLSLRHEGLPQGTEAFNLVLALDRGWEDHLDRMRTCLHTA